MTDNQIIKALGCCAKYPRNCAECPLCVTFTEPCSVPLARGALDLINRQKAEISVKNKLLDIAESKFETIKAEAFKEFVYNLKIKIGFYKMRENGWITDLIDNLANELISGKTHPKSTDDYCIVCGKPIPEGRHICPMCEHRGELK